MFNYNIYENLLALIELCFNIFNKSSKNGYLEGFSDAMILSEFKTIGLTLPRQSGKTGALLKLLNETNSLMFVKDNDIKNCIIHNNQQFKCNEKIHILEDKELIELPVDVDYIIIDDARFYFYLQSTAFYNWVAKEYGTTPIIILMN